MSEQTLDNVVELAMNYATDCARRAERFLTDVNPAPALAERTVEANNRQRFDEAVAKCHEAARSVINSCPPAAEVRRLLQEQEAEAAQKKAQQQQQQQPESGSAPVFSEAQFTLRRCEAAVGTFASVLFWIHNAPTKYELEMRDYTEDKQKLSNASKNAVLGVAPTENRDARRAPFGGMGRNSADAIGGTPAELGYSGGMSPDGAVRPGMSHLKPEDRARIEEIAAQSDPSKVQTFFPK